jgi:hypothetical protein
LVGGSIFRSDLSGGWFECGREAARLTEMCSFQIGFQIPGGSMSEEGVALGRESALVGEPAGRSLPAAVGDAQQVAPQRLPPQLHVDAGDIGVAADEEAGLGVGGFATGRS